MKKNFLVLLLIPLLVSARTPQTFDDSDEVEKITRKFVISIGLVDLLNNERVRIIRTAESDQGRGLPWRKQMIEELKKDNTEFRVVIYIRGVFSDEELIEIGKFMDTSAGSKEFARIRKLCQEFEGKESPKDVIDAATREFFEGLSADEKAEAVQFSRTQIGRELYDRLRVEERNVRDLSRDMVIQCLASVKEDERRMIIGPNKSREPTP